MEKKKTIILSWGVTVFAALCGLVAFCMIFIRSVITPFRLQESFTGLQVALGYSINNQPVFTASAGILLAYLFPLIGACVSVIGKGFKIPTLVAAAMMITGGALAFSTVQLLRNAIYIGTPSLAAGPIVAGIFALLGGLTLTGSIFLKD